MAATPNDAAGPLPRTELTFATYNIHGCSGRAAARFDHHRIAAAIQETGADLVALQEVREDAAGLDQVAAIAALLGMSPVFGPNMVCPRGSFRYGNALLSRLPLRDWANHDLSLPGREPRGLLVGRVSAPNGGTFAVGSVHLGLRHGERAVQVRRMLDEGALGSPLAEGMPVVLGGDMNDWFPGADTRGVRARLRDAWRARGRGGRNTYPALFPLLRLDKVLVAGDVEVETCAPLRTPLARSASDHLPVVARLSVAYYERCASRQEPRAASSSAEG